MKVEPRFKRLIVLIPVLVTALGAAAHYVQQLQATPADITSQSLIRDGYAVVETVRAPTPNDPRLVTVTITLERGDTVYRCYEMGTTRDQAGFSPQYHHCTRGAT